MSWTYKQYSMFGLSISDVCDKPAANMQPLIRTKSCCMLMVRLKLCRGYFGSLFQAFGYLGSAVKNSEWKKCWWGGAPPLSLAPSPESPNLFTSLPFSPLPTNRSNAWHFINGKLLVASGIGLNWSERRRKRREKDELLIFCCFRRIQIFLPTKQ